MTQLKIAKEYLKVRAFRTPVTKRKVLNQLAEVVPLTEVLAVIEMIEEGTFVDYLEKLKKEGCHYIFLSTQNKEEKRTEGCPHSRTKKVCHHSGFTTTKCLDCGKRNI
jgi:hypothetical protein